MPFEVEPDTNQQGATAAEILTECFEIGVQEACYEAGLRAIDAAAVIGE